MKAWPSRCSSGPQKRIGMRRGARVRVDVGDVRALDVRRVEDQLAGLLAGAHRHAVQLQQPAYDAHVADVGHVAQPARLAAEQGGDHGLRHEVLRAADTDLALQRGAAVDKQYIVCAGHESRVPEMGSGGARRCGQGPAKRVRAAHPCPVRPRTAPGRHELATTRSVHHRPLRSVTAVRARRGCPRLPCAP